MRTGPTAYALAPLLLAAGLGMLSPDGGLLRYAAAAALGVLAAAVVLRPRIGDLELTLVAPTRVPLGREALQALVVLNAGRRASSRATVTLRASGWPDLVVRVPGLAPGAGVELRGTRTPAARAFEASPVLTVRSTSPFGLVAATRTLQHPGPLVVHPDLPRRARALRGAWRHGGQFAGVREWHPGDGLRDVSARHSARRGTPVAVLREPEATSPVALVLTGPSDREGFEAAVAECAGLALQALQARVPVALFGLTAAPLVPRRAEQVLDACAAVREPLPREPSLAQARSWAGPTGEVVVR